LGKVLYFSPRQADAPLLTRPSPASHPGGQILCTQTFQKEPNRALEISKPLLKFLTTIDFGNVTYEPDFYAAVKRAGLQVLYSSTVDEALAQT
jgi:hypothetical protein